ncbi:hypothetical protein F5878DRAFT_615542 [Lentinula raphanica]|uniref:Uncharacterized protein n=1 Tax=Lentinula raphanica TaxID=153919 RepID=A0AA38UFX8_9AGAR|nr:hypothetical protein F5878DRAFT_615542 [Lentinula raphanica]
MVHISAHKMLALKLALVFIFLSSTCGLPVNSPVNSPEMVPHSQPSSSDITPKIVTRDLSMITPSKAVGRLPDPNPFAIPRRHSGRRVSPSPTGIYTIVVRWKLAKGRQKSSPPVIPSAGTNPHWTRFEHRLRGFLRSKMMKEWLGFLDLSRDDFARTVAIVYDHSWCSFQDAIGPPGELRFELETSYSLKWKYRVAAELNLKSGDFTMHQAYFKG